MLTRLQCAKLVLGIALIAGGVWITGCAPSRIETLSLGTPAWHAGAAGSNCEAIFDGPEAAAVAQTYGHESLPEYSRLDATLNRYEPGPRLATNQWPSDPRPDASNVRWVYLPAYNSGSVQVVPVYQPEGQRYWHSSRRWW